LENGFIAASLKFIYNTPFVVTVHGGDVYDVPFRDSWHNNLARYILSEADQVITVSRFNVNKLAELGVSSKKIHVIPNGYDENSFKPFSSFVARKTIGLPINKKILLSVGNLVDVKGHFFLIDAMALVSKVRKDVLLIILGSGVLREKLQKRIKLLDLNQRVLLVESRSHAEIPIWMNACDIFVLPSLGEGFPTVIPEAMACGKPIVGTTVGGVPEALSNPDVGILVKPGHSVALADAILNAIQTRWQTEIILNYAKKYSWDNVVKEILNVYGSLPSG
jgi:glycosyltransferase involved in cell wall biosynthesis